MIFIENGTGEILARRQSSEAGGCCFAPRGISAALRQPCDVVRTRAAAAPDHLNPLQKTPASFPLNFSCICPEPVLVKYSVFCHKRKQKRRFPYTYRLKPARTVGCVVTWGDDIIKLPLALRLTCHVSLISHAGHRRISHIHSRGNSPFRHLLCSGIGIHYL